MPVFSNDSQIKLKQLDPLLQDILEEAIKHMDFTIVCGHRSKKEQDIAFQEGKSKLQYPMSKHNQLPSKAVDIAPYPIDWNDIERFAYLIGFILGIATIKGIEIRTGYDWNGNGNIRDQSFMDRPHIELI